MKILVPHWMKIRLAEYVPGQLMTFDDSTEGLV